MDIYAISWLIGAVSIWLGLAFLVGQLATTRNRSRLGWVIRAILVSPMVALIFLYATPKRELQASEGSPSGSFFILKGEEMVKCPFCAELIKSEAKVCRHCSREVESAIAAVRAQDRDSTASTEAALLQEQTDKAVERTRLAQERKESLRAILQSPPKAIGLGLALALLLGVLVAIPALLITGNSSAAASKPTEISSVFLDTSKACPHLLIRFDTSNDSLRSKGDVIRLSGPLYKYPSEGRRSPGGAQVDFQVMSGISCLSYDALSLEHVANSWQVSVENLDSGESEVTNLEYLLW